MIDRRKLYEEFDRMFGGEPRLFRSPGRVNLIGEHTDYNDGFVLPMAIDRETAVAIRARDDRTVRVHTMNLDKSAEFDLDRPADTVPGSWVNYIEGVARILELKGVKLKGTDMLICSDVPNGAGLSSSAALETVVGLSLSAIADANVDRETLAKVGQQAEHEYAGARVGIMDQFVALHAHAGHALLLDCRSLKYENVPLDTSSVAVAICDTNVKHNLASSEYNVRRMECERAVEILKEFIPGIRALRDVSAGDLEKYADKLPEPVNRRARHVVTENERTLQAAEALRQNDLSTFGLLMWQSHASLKNDYEVSCRELDILVEIAGETQGVLGARMTGGGFGGSTVSLVEREFLPEFEEAIRNRYKKATDIDPTILISEPGEGADEIDMKKSGHAGSDKSQGA